MFYKGSFNVINNLSFVKDVELSRMVEGNYFAENFSQILVLSNSATST